MDFKTRSIRADENTLERFKAISEEFDNQSVALETLINAYELQKSKAVLTDVKTDIEDFDSHLNSIQKGYLHVLELNQNAEHRIRGEFQQQLESKDKQIIDLQQRVDKAELSAKTSEDTANTLQATLEEQSTANAEALITINEKLSNANERISTLETAIMDKQVIIDSLNKQLATSTEQIDMAESALTQLDELQKKLSNAETTIKSLEEKLVKQEQQALEQSKLAEERAELNVQRAVLEERSKSQGKIEQLMQHNDELVTQRANSQTKVEQLIQQNNELVTQVAELNSQIATQKKKEEN
jgi:chromosome segregation ATPase